MVHLTPIHLKGIIQRRDKRPYRRDQVMRIRQGPEPKPKRRLGTLWKQMRAYDRRDWALLALVMCLVVVIAGGIWDELEDTGLISPLLFGRRARTGPDDGLPALYLELSPEAYQTMYRQWHASLRTGIPSLEESDWVQGQLRYGGRTFPIAIWLQEESPEHWQDTKWSLQIKLRAPPNSRAPTTLLDMRGFVARSPATRRSLDEWLYSEVLRGVGVLAPRYTFAHLWMNGDDWGVYALQEMLSDTFLTTQQRSPGVILRVDDSLFGRQQAQLAGGMRNSGGRADAGTWAGIVQADEGIAAEIERDPALQEQYAAAVGLLKGFQSGQLAPARVFDAEQMGRYLAHAQWWGARYGTWFEGERYAYNALTSRLEPIGGDALPLEASYAHVPGLAQYGDLAVMAAYVRQVERIAQPETIEALQAVYQDSLRHYQAALARELPASERTAPWRMLSERQAILLRSLYSQETVHVYRPSQETTSGHLHVANLSTYPVVLDDLWVGERTTRIEREWIVDDRGALLDAEPASTVVLAPLSGTIPRYLDLDLPEAVQRELWPHDEPSEEPIRLATHVAGLAKTVLVDVQRDLPPLHASTMPARPTVEQALAQHPFLATCERPGFLRLEPGDWDVRGDLVLPAGYGLLASGPAHLRFDAGAIILADGPLLLYGSENDEIVLGPKEHNWAGIVVLEAGDQIPSSLSHVVIVGTSGVQRNGWHVPGGVTFYQSPVTLSHCRLIDTIAPTALYVARTHFECEESEFGRISSQALHSEYAEGRLSNCRFYDVLGNAIAARGSRIDAQGSIMLRVHDQAILARQNSVVSARGGYTEDVNVVVASIDGSHVQVEGMSIRRLGMAGLAAYTSEPGASPASIHASGLTFDSEHVVETLVQPGSSVRLDGQAASARAFETERLGWREGITTTIRPLDYRLGPSIWLAGYNIVSQDLEPGEPLRVNFYWYTSASLDREYTIFIHIRDAAGEMVAGWDTMPRQNTYPTTEWQAGQMVDDLHVVPLDLPSGTYQIALGMYHLGSGQRLSVYRPDGEPVADASILLDQRFRVNEP
jgi:hypothetical protein